MRNYGPCHSLAFDIWVFNTWLYHITPQHIAKASAAGSVTGGWTFPTLASVATVFFLIALNNLAPIAINQYHMNLSTLAGKWFQDAELIKEQSNWKLHNQEIWTNLQCLEYPLQVLSHMKVVQLLHLKLSAVRNLIPTEDHIIIRTHKLTLNDKKKSVPTWDASDMTNQVRFLSFWHHMYLSNNQNQKKIRHTFRASSIVGILLLWNSNSAGSSGTSSFIYNHML